jgi:ribosomal protein L11 methyltransferase
MRWTKIWVKCDAAETDSVAAALLEAGCGGTEHPERGVAGYLPVDDTLEGRLNRLRARLDQISEDFASVSPEIALTFVEEEDWAEAWKAHFHPIPIGKRLVVAPTWSEFSPKPDQIVVWLDPGMAFGTGSHPTTQLCLEALERFVEGGETALDWGTGSGVLAVAAAKLGASRVVAGDIDPLAVSIARENAIKNDAADRIVFLVGETPSCARVQCDLATCNILAGVIITLADDLASSIKEGGLLLASGIIDSRETEVASALEMAGFHLTETLRRGEWVALIARRASG